MEATYHMSKYLKVLSQALLIPSLFPPSATQPSGGIALEIQRLVVSCFLLNGGTGLVGEGLVEAPGPGGSWSWAQEPRAGTRIGMALAPQSPPLPSAQQANSLIPWFHFSDSGRLCASQNYPTKECRQLGNPVA